MSVQEITQNLIDDRALLFQIKYNPDNDYTIS